MPKIDEDPALSAMYDRKLIVWRNQNPQFRRDYQRTCVEESPDNLFKGFANVLKFYAAIAAFGGFIWALILALKWYANAVK